MPVVDVNSIKIADYLHVKGVKLAEPGMPQWKIKPLREKNLQLINEYLEQEAERQKEEEKWAAIPEWKRPLLREREKKKKELEEAQKQLEEAERKEREKFEQLPEWKRQVLTKRKSVSSDPDAYSDTKSEASSHSEGATTEKTLLIQEPKDNGHTTSATAGDDNSEPQEEFKSETKTASESVMEVESVQN